MSDVQQMQQSAETNSLELAYEKARCQFNAICNTESARQLRLQTLLLEDENDDLQTQLTQSDERIDELERYVQDLQCDIEAAVKSWEDAKGDLRKKTRELGSLKAELNSLHGITMDSTKLLTEKLTLARELSSLKPELDHLRSQASMHQSLLAEKLSLQRQVSTMQVELENEKRSTQRVFNQEGRTHTEDSKLETQLEAVRAELTKEKKGRQNAERETQRSSTVMENKITMLESRLETFRGKLKTTKEALKETQIELQKAQTVNFRASSTAVPYVPAARNSRKRTASEIDAETMIGTPGDLPAAKKAKAKSTLPGEKSTFSITPFLNRTATTALQTVTKNNENSNDEDNPERSLQSPSKLGRMKTLAHSLGSKNASAAQEKDDDGPGKEPSSLSFDRSRKAISRPPPAVRKGAASSVLEEVVEEVSEAGGDLNPAISDTIAHKFMPDEGLHDGVERKKNKRKLLGGLCKTLFDEEEGDDLKGERRMTGGARGLGILGRGGAGGTRNGPVAAGGFGAFSPRKRDRKVTVT